MKPFEHLTPFQRLLSRHIGSAFARQLAFAEIVGKLDWSVDLDQGTIGFGDRLSFPCQLLGSQSNGDGSWLWSWANEAAGFPAGVMQSAIQMKEFGAREGIAELFEPQFVSDVAYGETIALVATGMNSGTCYYRGPYRGGAAFLLVMNVPPVVTQPADSARILSVIPNVISQWEVDHAEMIDSFLKQQGFHLERNGSELTATRGNDQIRIGFDNLGRMAKLDGNLNTAKKSKPWWKFW